MTLSRNSKKTIGLIQLDSGFLGDDVLKIMKEKAIHYSCVKLCKPIQKTISLQQNWIQVDTGWKIAEMMYQAESWRSYGLVFLDNSPIALSKGVAGISHLVKPNEENGLTKTSIKHFQK
ncbi:MAG: hypothetical protein H7Y13_16005 [Sphingobacteriaceae bacterium]|nr:hypothetical protein [Sphingobacteriaceae bacterium]